MLPFACDIRPAAEGGQRWFVPGDPLNGSLRAGDAAQASAFADRLAALCPDDPTLARFHRSLQGR